MAGRGVELLARQKIQLVDYLLLGAATGMAVLEFVVVEILGVGSHSSALYYVGNVLLIVAAAVSMRMPAQRGNGRLMAGIPLVGAFVGLCYDWGQTGPWLMIGDAIFPIGSGLFGHLLFRWPRARLQTGVQRAVLWGAYALLPICFLVSDLTWDVAWWGQSSVERWWITIAPEFWLSWWSWASGEAIYAALAIVFLVLVVLRIYRASRLERRELISVGVAATWGALSAMVGVGVALSWWSSVHIPLLNNLSILTDLAILTVPLSFLAAVAVRRIQRATAVEALVTPGRLSDAAAVQQALRKVMGDKGLAIALYSVELGRYLSADAEITGDPRPGRSHVYVPSPDGSPLARLEVATSLANRPELTGAVARAAVMALDTARLRAELELRARDEADVRRQLDDATEEGERLSRLLPTGLPDKLRTDPGALGRVDEAVVTVLMSDVRGYTSIAERSTPTQLAEQLQEHRTAMNGAILAEGGTVMQYVGDSVMAVFGAPFPQADHAERGVRAAAAMHLAQSRLNRAWAALGWKPFGLGIGLSTGPVVTAILGSKDRYEYTIVGDTVNLAQRLESQARPAGTTLASEATIAALSRTAAEFDMLPPFDVKGRSAPVVAFRSAVSLPD